MFYDTQRKIFLNETELPLEPNEANLLLLSQYGFFRVKFETIKEESDPGAEVQECPCEDRRLEPLGEPEASEDDPLLYIQKMKPVYFLPQMKTEKKAELAAYRWERQCLGFYVREGTIILTSPDDLARLASTLQLGSERIDFKTMSGWISFERKRLEEIFRLAGAYVQACYHKEMELCAAIDNAESIYDLNMIDTLACWPDNREG